MALVDSELRPLNFMFLLWIVEFTKNKTTKQKKNSSIYEKQQPHKKKPLKNNIIRIENL